MIASRLFANRAVRVLLLSAVLAPAAATAQVDRPWGHSAPSRQLETVSLDDTLCRPEVGEWSVYSCKFGSKIASVCFGDKGGGAIYYRFGKKKKIEIEIKSNGKDGVAKVTTPRPPFDFDIAFRRGEYAYTVYTRSAQPPHGSDWRSGVTVTQNGRVISTRVCSEAGRFQDITWESLPNIVAPPP